MEAERNPTGAAPPPPSGVRYLPGERVLLLTVHLPAMSAAQRRTTVGFAVEDQIAAPLDVVHVVLGPAIGDRWLVAVVARDVLVGAPPDRKVRLLPDTLALPVPERGHWAVWAGGDRALVRTEDGAGFATTITALPVFHAVAGQPRIVLHGGALDARFADVRPAALPPRPDAALDRFDLGLGRGDVAGLPLPATLRRMAAVLAVAAAGHLGLLAADLWAMGRIAQDQQAGLRDLLQRMGQPVGDDLDGAITQTLARANGETGPRLIPTMSRVFTALAPHAGRVTLGDMRYGADQRGLTLVLQAPDIVTLQNIETALKAAGFRVTAGAATTAGGLAEQQMALQEGGA
jgi:general secretion pathway protein L